MPILIVRISCLYMIVRQNFKSLCLKFKLRGSSMVSQNVANGTANTEDPDQIAHLYLQFAVFRASYIFH